jgi:deoxyadenosine/deoxycytidine kinase
MQSNTYIAIEGNIGSGKTTLAHKLAKSLNAHLLLEEFENNDFLKTFYAAHTKEEKENAAFATELHFILERYKQQKNHFSKSENSITVSDYVPQKCRLFAKMNLTDEQFETYQQTYHQLMQNIPNPNILIYLKRDVDVLMSNIKKRARPYEKDIQKEYLLKIEVGYEALMKLLPNSTKVLYITEDELKKPDFESRLLKLLINY